MDTNHAWETFDRFLRENVRTIVSAMTRPPLSPNYPR